MKSNLTEYFLNNSLIILDLDNTLINEKLYLKERLIKCLKDYQISDSFLKDILEYFEMYYQQYGNDKIFSKLTAKFDLDIEVEIFRNELSKVYALDSSFLFHKVLDSIVPLKELRKFVVITNGSESIQQSKIKTINSYLGFKIQVIFLKGVFKKPNPESLLKLISQYGVAKNQVIVIGDLKTDQIYAQQAGVHFQFIQNLYSVWGHS